MDQRHVVVAGDDVPEGGQALLHPLDADSLRQTVPDVLQLLVGGVVGHQQAVTVPWSCDQHRQSVRTPRPDGRARVCVCVRAHPRTSSR